MSELCENWKVKKKERGEGFSNSFLLWRYSAAGYERLA